MEYLTGILNLLIVLGLAYFTLKMLIHAIQNKEYPGIIGILLFNIIGSLFYYFIVYKKYKIAPYNHNI